MGRSTDVVTEAKVERGSDVSLSVCLYVLRSSNLTLHILCSIRTFATGKLYLSENSKRSYHVKTIACYATLSAIIADESEALNLDAIYLFLFN